jgi:aspartate aminotransferase
MRLSNRVLALKESPVRKLVPIATLAKKNGKKVYHLNIGQPDVKTPKVFMDAINNYDTDIIRYSFSSGEPVLIKAIQDYFKRDGIIYDDENILITNGGSEAVTFATIAVCDPFDEILVPEPFYTNYNGFTGEVNAKIVPITTKAEDGYHLPEKAEIVKLITPRTKAIMFSNPGNPTGTILRQEEMEMIAEIAIEFDLFVISDEVYRGMAFDGLEGVSMGAIKGIEDRLIVLESVSKRYSACGARIGALCSHNKELIANILKLCQARLCVATLEQIGAAALYQLPQSYTESIKDEYQKRRDIAFNALSNIPGVVCKKPTGAFYFIFQLPVEDAEKFIIWMLEEFELDGETIMLAPAEGFYATPGLGKNEARIAYVLNETEMKRAMYILEKGLEAYNNLK